MTNQDTYDYRVRELKAARPRPEDDYNPSIKVRGSGGESKWLRITPAEYHRVVAALTTEPGITYRVQPHNIRTLTWPMWEACGIECPAMIGADCPGNYDGRDPSRELTTCPGWSGKFPHAAAEVVHGWSLDSQPETCGDTEQPIGFNAIFRAEDGDDPDAPMGAGVILTTDSQGSVSLVRYETATELDGIWGMLQDKEAEYDRANCEECTDDGPCWNHGDGDESES